MLRCLAEITWFPTAWLSDNIQWQAIDDHSPQATLNDHGLTVTTTLHFNSENQIVKLTSDRYYEGKLEQWTVLCADYRELNDLQIPIKAEVIWILKAGDFNNQSVPY